MPLHDFRCVFMPYALKPVKNPKNGKTVYEVRNREYLPIGFGNRGYHDHYEKHMTVELTKSTLQKLSVYPIDDEDIKDIRLYYDGSIPNRSKKNMDDYLKKVAILMKAKIVR